jgi:hypothetical protein
VAKQLFAAIIRRNTYTSCVRKLVVLIVPPVVHSISTVSEGLAVKLEYWWRHSSALLLSSALNGR